MKGVSELNEFLNFYDVHSETDVMIVCALWLITRTLLLDGAVRCSDALDDVCRGNVCRGGESLWKMINKEALKSYQGGWKGL